MILSRFTLDKDKLDTLPENEYVLFHTLGHIFDEINGIQKMLYWASNEPKTDEAQKHGSNTLVIMLIQILAGKLNEAWEFFKKNYFRSELSRIYDSKLNNDAKEALYSLKRYYGKTNAIKTIRDKFAFHYSKDEISNQYIDETNNLLIYIYNIHYSNNLFFFSESIQIHILEKLLITIDEKYTIEKLINDLFKIVKWQETLIDLLMCEIIQNNKLVLHTAKVDKIELKNLQNHKDFMIPWFTDTSSMFDDNRK
jgi:hypothetical protein